MRRAWPVRIIWRSWVWFEQEINWWRQIGTCGRSYFHSLSGLLYERTFRLFFGSWRQREIHQVQTSMWYLASLPRNILSIPLLKALLFDMLQNSTFIQITLKFYSNLHSAMTQVYIISLQSEINMVPWGH